MNFLSHLEFSGTTILWALAGVAFGLTTLILLTRYFLRKQQRFNERKLYTQRTKYAEVDILRRSGTIFNLGLAVATLLAVLAFNWTTYDPVAEVPDGYFDMEDIIETDVPITRPEPPPPPPPPPPLIEPVPDDEPIEDPIQVDRSITPDEPVAIPEPVVVDKPLPPAPPPPPPPTPKEPEYFVVVEQMPRFAGCEELIDAKEAKACSEKHLFGFLKENLKYPKIAREVGVQGTAVIRFIVETDGSISNAEIMRDPGAGTGAEALRVVRSMPTWQPGEQRGRKVRVQYNLPVRFRLQ